MKTWLGRVALIVVVLLSIHPNPIAAQLTAIGRVTGAVTDALGRPLADTQLHLQAPDGSEEARATADQHGRFTFANIAPWTYAITADKPDFQTGTAIVTVTGGGAADTTITLTATKPLDLPLTAKQLDAPRLA